MHNIVEIMKKDLKASFQNPIVVIVLVAIIILPSLYALLNIQACWDPYENTGEVQFAIANLDKGATYDGEKLNVGNELEKELKKNDNFDWVFVSEKELREGVHDGKYYAGIVIPKNLSKSVISITTDDPHSAELQYVVNIKANPVANKLTDSGANAVYNTMNAKIVEFINLAAYGKLGDLQSSLSSGAGQMSSGAVQLTSGASQVSSGASQVSSGASQVSSGVSQVSDGAKQVQNGASQVSEGASQVSSGSGAVSEGAKQVSESSKQVSSGSKQVQDSAKQLESSVDTSKLPEGQVKQVVEGSIQLANASSQVAGGSNSLAEGSVKLANSSAALANGASDVAKGAGDVANGASDVADGAVSLAGGSDELAQGALSLAAGAELLSNSAAQALITAASSLSGAAGSLSSITGVNESLIGDYFFSPVKLDRDEVFSVSNYGSNVAPFYIVLSMWVGAVITCVMIKPGNSEGTKYSPLEMYFGKLVLFILMSILQALVTISGAFLLGIDIDNPLMFIFSACLISAIFMILLYSFISALGQVGKAVGVVLLVLQISGTGGIYPIEIMDHVFQILYPFLPMTYAITMLRESLLGMVWSNYIPALIILIGLGAATVIVSIIIKVKAEKASHYFEERLEETGLF